MNRDGESAGKSPGSWQRRASFWLCRCSTLMASAAGITLFLLMLLTVGDVFMRYVFNAPIVGVWDLTQAAMVVITFFSLSYCGLSGAHIAIDFVSGAASPRLLKIIDRLGSMTGAVVMFVLCWRGVLYAEETMRTRAASMTLLMPFYPLVYVVAFGCAAFGLVMLYRAISATDFHPPHTQAGH